MKRITMIVPDSINFSLSTFETHETTEKPVTKEIIIKALETAEYDEHYSFPEGSVKIESIKTVKPKN